MITDQIGLYSVLLPLFSYMVRETQAFFSNLSLFQNSYMKKRSVSVCIDFSFVASLVQNIGQPYSTVFFLFGLFKSNFLFNPFSYNCEDQFALVMGHRFKD